jgi:hypothetical protein
VRKRESMSIDVDIQKENPIKFLVDCLKNLSFLEILTLIDYARNMYEEDKKILRNFIKLIQEEL